MIGRTVGRYRVLSKLGQGGLASVWKAHDELLGRAVALKTLRTDLHASPKSRRRFLHEAQTAAALDHPGIVAVYESGEADDVAYIALQLVDGETVSERASRRLLPFDDAVRIARAAAEALAHAHARQVIHRDVTSRNIMVAHDGRVFVLDFGLALAAWESRLTSTETTLGTAHYVAPEVIRGGEADARSDLYGLGVVLYEALTGTFPFSGDQAPAVFYAAINLPPVSPRRRRPDLPPALERFILKAIARDASLRHQSAAEFLAELRAIDLDEPVPSDRARGASTPGVVPAVADRVAEGPAPDPTAPLYLAVLPFEAVHQSPDPEGAVAALAGRLAESLSCALAKSSSVRVVPPQGASVPAEPREAARQLGAHALLQGSVRRAGSQLRVAYALTDPWRGVQLAGDLVDGSAFDVFDVEDRVVASVCREMKLDLAPGETSAERTSDPAAHERYQQALGYLKRYDNEASVDGAIYLLERLIASEGDVAAYHAALARAYLHKHERTKQRIWESRAAGACARAQMLDATAPATRIALGELRLRSGQHAAALDDFDAALAAEPQSFDALLGRARAHAAAGQLDEAERACQRVLEAQPRDWRGHLLLGRIHLLKGEFSRALTTWQRVVELTPDNSLGRRHLGSALYRLDRHDEAVEAYQESLDIQPSDEAYGNLGTALYFLERYDESIAALRKATELTPSDPIRWGNLGSVCHWLPGREREAESALECAIGLMRERLERDPSRADWWALLSNWLARRGRHVEALVAIRTALERAPRDIECMVQAGHVYFQVGDRAQCLHWLRAARRAGYGAAELRRSRELAPLRDDPEFQQILALSPDRPEASEQPRAGQSAG